MRRVQQGGHGQCFCTGHGCNAFPEQHQKAPRAFAASARFEGHWLHQLSAGRQFKQALDHRLNKCSLRQGIGGENPCGREKLSRLQRCLAESDREITRDFIRRASAIAIAQDGRQNRLLMRFSACTPNLEIKKAILGAQEVIGETISNVVVAMERVIERFATPGWGGPCAQEMDSSLREHLRNSVTIFVADAASNEQGAGRVSKSFFPNLVSIQRDRAHACALASSMDLSN